MEFRSASRREQWDEGAGDQQRGDGELGHAQHIGFAAQAEHREPGDERAVGDERRDALRQVET